MREFDVDPRRVLFDATNFFTFIDTFNARSTLAQRGHSKEGRKALRIVGVALLVAADGHLPLLHRTYPGNTPDAPTFAGLTGALAARYRDIRRDAERITLVFDKGNNSKDNLQAVAESPYHFIGSLAPRYPDLLATPADKLRPLDGDGLPGVRAHRTVRTVFGAQRTVLVTHNENLFDAQSQTLLREIAKRRQRLRELQQRLRGWRSGRVRGPRPPTAESVEKKVSACQGAPHICSRSGSRTATDCRDCNTGSTGAPGCACKKHCSARPSSSPTTRTGRCRGARLPRPASCRERLPP